MVGSVWGLGNRLDGTRFEKQQGIFHISRMSKLALGHTQPSIQWLPGLLSLRVKLVPHLHLGLRLGVSGATLLLPYTPLWCAQGQLLYLYCHMTGCCLASLVAGIPYECVWPLRCISLKDHWHLKNSLHNLK